jgi:hypothetical protein
MCPAPATARVSRLLLGSMMQGRSVRRGAQLLPPQPGGACHRRATPRQRSATEKVPQAGGVRRSEAHLVLRETDRFHELRHLIDAPVVTVGHRVRAVHDHPARQAATHQQQHTRQRAGATDGLRNQPERCPLLDLRSRSLDLLLDRGNLVVKAVSRRSSGRWGDSLQEPGSRAPCLPTRCGPRWTVPSSRRCR